jgi:hypothetical protein
MRNAYIMGLGRITKEGTPEEFAKDPEVRKYLLGLGEEGRLSIREMIRNNKANNTSPAP